MLWNKTKPNGRPSVTGITAQFYKVCPNTKTKHTTGKSTAKLVRGQVFRIRDQSVAKRHHFEHFYKVFYGGRARLYCVWSRISRAARPWATSDWSRCRVGLSCHWSSFAWMLISDASWLNIQFNFFFKGFFSSLFNEFLFVTRATVEHQVPKCWRQAKHKFAQTKFLILVGTSLVIHNCFPFSGFRAVLNMHVLPFHSQSSIINKLH